MKATIQTRRSGSVVSGRGTSAAADAARIVLQPRSRLLAGLRVVPAALLFAGFAMTSPATGATGCPSANVAVSGGTVRNETVIDLSADGGVAVSDARGGDDNIAVGGNGGFVGDGGSAAAGNGGVAVSDASGGMIDLDNINSGDNSGNTIAVSGLDHCGYGDANVAISGGEVTNTTTIAVSADGGTAVSDARGGDDNIAVGGAGGFFGDGGNAAAGNGGVAIADASGGAVTIGNINSGNNRGNTILLRRGRGWFGRAGLFHINGGTVRNSTTVAISADGGTAVANAQGGDGNIAVAGSGGLVGDGGNAAAGNGGVAIADASGGAVTIGNVNSGGNSGNTIAVEGGYGDVYVDGGTVTNETTIAVSADGGTAVSDASGGDDNIAVGGNGGVVGDGGAAAAGNGGVAASDASGGSVAIGNVNSGGNSGNTIVVE